MKKLLTLLLAVGFLFGMVACGGESTSTEEATTEEAAPAVEEVEAVEEVAPVEEAADSTATEAEGGEMEAEGEEEATEE